MQPSAAMNRHIAAQLAKGYPELRNAVFPRRIVFAPHQFEIVEDQVSAESKIKKKYQPNTLKHEHYCKTLRVHFCKCNDVKVSLSLSSRNGDGDGDGGDKVCDDIICLPSS